MATMPTTYLRARQRFDAGQLAEAEQMCRGALDADENTAWSWRLLGLISHRRGERELACQRLQRAIELDPGDAESHLHGAELFRQAGRLLEAESAARSAASLRPDSPAPLNNLGLVLQDAGRLEEAEAAFAQATRIASSYPRAHCNLGCLYLRQNRLPEAIAALRQAVRLQPDYPQALTALGEALRRMGLPDVALARFQRALSLKPDYLPALLNLGNSLADLGQYDQARAILERAVTVDPNYGPAHHDLGALHESQRDWPAALSHYEKASSLEPGNLAFGVDLENARRQVCDWKGYSDSVPRLIDACLQRAGRDEPSPIGPFVSLRFPTSNADRLAIARQYSRHIARAADSRFESDHRRIALKEGERLRLGFLSHQFNTSVYGHLTQGLYERFDRRFFEVVGLDYSRPDDSVYRQRIRAGCDGLLELGGLSSVQMAQRIADCGVHILVDLDSYLLGGRPEVIAWRAAPIQVSYLYPATTGSAAFDYLIVDPVVAPAGIDEFFTEKLVRIPVPYMLPSEPALPADPANRRRREWGLPEDGFVYASFNAVDKLDPPTFDVWMRILARAPQSILWLLCELPLAQANLRREAERRGVDPARLLFAPRAPFAQHMARMPCANLFLDTLNHGAHATAIDALGAGLAILTCPGSTMASRVAASLLTALDCPELIAKNVDDFETTAVDFALEADRWRPLRQSLSERAARGALFDCHRHVRCLESAFREMWRRYCAGAAPAPISLPVTIPST